MTAPPALSACFRPGSWVLFLIPLAVGSICWAHDIPNQRVDRSIQATLRPGRLQIDYEVSLTELTLTQDLRSLIGSLPGADRTEWLARYGEVTGPLNAKGFLVACDGLPVELVCRGFDLAVEEHPRYTFHLEANLPAKGRLTIHDTNFVSSEGTSRLAVRTREGVVIEGDPLPEDVSQVPIKPLWQLDDEEERRTKQVKLDFRSSSAVLPPPETLPQPLSTEAEPSAIRRTETSNPLSSLLDRGSGASWLGLVLIAAGLGAVHAIQPGHGKTLVSAVALGPEARWYHPALLGLTATSAHTGSVLVIAAALWWTGASQVAGLHRSLVHLAGFAIAAGGFLRMGRAIGQRAERMEATGGPPAHLSLGEILGLGLAGGLAPCWDAVGLVVLATALGRLGTGVILVMAFGLGMAAVLVSVGLLASRLKAAAELSTRFRGWETGLEFASGLILAAIGLVFFLS